MEIHFSEQQRKWFLIWQLHLAFPSRTVVKKSPPTFLFTVKQMRWQVWGNWKHPVESASAHNGWNATAMRLMAPVICTGLLNNQRLWLFLHRQRVWSLDEVFLSCPFRLSLSLPHLGQSFFLHPHNLMVPYLWYLKLCHVQNLSFTPLALKSCKTGLCLPFLRICILILSKL